MKKRTIRTISKIIPLLIVLTLWGCEGLSDEPEPGDAFRPNDAAMGVDVDIDLSWDEGYDIQYFDVYFGTTNPPPLVEAGYEFSQYELDTLEYDTTYYWRIDSESWDGRVFVGDELSFTTCSESLVLWSENVGNQSYFASSSPKVETGLVYVSGGQNLWCFDSATGAEIWRKDAGISYTMQGESSPIIANDRVYIGGSNTFYCFDSATGADVWSYTGLTESKGEGFVSGGNVYFTDWEWGGGTVYCVSDIDGSLVWSNQMGATDLSSPVVAGGNVFVDGMDSFYCLNATDGSEIWSSTKASSSNSGHDGCKPLIEGNFVYATDRDGIYCLNATDGSRVWETDIGRSTSSPVIANGRLFISGNKGLYCLNPTSGAVLWSEADYAMIYASPVCSNNDVFVGKSGGMLCANESDGSIVWQYYLYDFRCTPYVDSGRVYVTSIDGDLVCLDVNGRK